MYLMLYTMGINWLRHCNIFTTEGIYMVRLQCLTFWYYIIPPRKMNAKIHHSYLLMLVSRILSAAQVKKIACLCQSLLPQSSFTSVSSQPVTSFPWQCYSISG